MKQFFSIGAIIFVFGYFIENSIRLTSNSNEITDKVDLGRKLFFDPILSSDYSISCASCHKPAFAFADSSTFSTGVNGHLSRRNTPSVINVLYQPYFFYDGRAKTLEEQVIVPIEDSLEMNLPYAEAVMRIQNNLQYKLLFDSIYDEGPDSLNISNAIATFIRSLESPGNAPHDYYMNEIDTFATTPSQKRGLELFVSDEFKCFECHFSPTFTGDEFKNIGLYDGQKLNDKGRYEASGNIEDLGKFKVPSLRNVALTAPYMHNGMFNTLEEVIDYYSNPYDFVQDPINMDSLMIEPLHFSDQQKEDLVNFLHSLTDSQLPY